MTTADFTYADTGCDLSMAFIVGMGRCGTTRLLNILGLHPEISIIPKEPHLFIYNNGLVHFVEAVLNSKDVEIAAKRLRGKLGGLDLFGDSTALVDAYIKHAWRPHTTAERIIPLTRAFVLSLFSRVNGVMPGRCVEKTPHNLFVIDWIWRLFPEAKIVHIKRDPRGVLESWTRMPWGPEQGNIRANAAHMDTLYARWAALLPYRNNPNYHELKLETLTVETNRELNKICRFLDVPIIEWSDDCFTRDKQHDWRDHPDAWLIDGLSRPHMRLMGYA